MANYTDLANLAVGTGGLPSGTTVTALRDNPIAIAEGAVGAPGIDLKAIKVTDGEVIRFQDSSTVTTTSTTFQTVLSYIFFAVGPIRVRFEHSATSAPSPTDSCEARVVRTRGGTSTVLQTWSTSQATFQRTLVVDVQPGDTVLIQHRKTANVFSGAAQIAKRRFLTGGENLWPIFQGGVENDYT